MPSYAVAESASSGTIQPAPVKGGAADAAQRYESVLWKTDVYLNPNRPQFGTWQYARAGWAPGDVVRPWWIDLTEFVPGKEAEVRYEASAYDFSGAPKVPGDKQINQASHVVRSYLILYRARDALVPAPVLLVTNVAAKSNAANAGIKRGDYLASYDGARLDSVDDLRAAIQGAKETSRLVPLCHPIGIDQIAIDFEEIEESPLFGIRVRAAVRTDARTGVEMEALTAVTVSLLTIYDMCKSVDRQMHFRSVRLEEKTGGTSGSWSREDATETD